MEKEVYRVAEFCEKYATSRSSFYREISAKRLKIIKRGRSTIVTRRDAEEWLETLRRNGGAA